LLSGGEQQMLAIARALMGEPELLVLDEPSLGLAPAITQSVFETLKSLHEESGLSLLIVEQNAELSLGIANHAYVLEAGVIQVDGPAESIRDDAGLRRAYLGY
jgi:branched-chain amino acid transport system ATP-binding protein